MFTKRSRLSFFIGLLALYAAVFAVVYRHRTSTSRAPALGTSKSEYLHYDFIDIFLIADDPSLREIWSKSAPRVAVLRDGRAVKTIASIEEVPLRYNPAGGAWEGRWPCPWNAPSGRYELELRVPAGENGAYVALSDLSDLAPEKNADPQYALAQRLAEKKYFRVVSRKPRPVPQGLSVLTLESVSPFRNMKVRAPDGSMKDWRGLLDWVQYVGADAFWVLGGQTPGSKPGEVWVSENFGIFPEMARECRKRGIKFGIYAMCYLTMSKEKLPGYEYALEVKDGATVPTRAISIRDSKRVADVAALLKRFQAIEGVDYLGLDYIRNALGGYELVDDFYTEMPGVRPPPGWEKLDREERMVYFARKKIMRRDEDFIDAWQWWRAHRVAGIVTKIKAALGERTPLWAFTLTWDKGWQHGQDPVMMNDAGVDADALMLYEADEAQFNGMLRDWNRYVKRADVQLIVGDVVDWPLHQRSAEGPKALYRRLSRAVDRIYSDGPARGLFIHDLDRALWGRLGGWSTRQWMDEARDAVKYLKSRPLPSAAPR